MSLVESTMMNLGTTAPEFKLPDTVSGEHMSLSELKGEHGTLVYFTCNHCPYVIHVNDEILRLANTYQAKGIKFVAISSNDVIKYPQDDPEKMKALAAELKFPFPYLYDESQEVAKAYAAACTPDFYLFNKENELYYRGRIDGSRPGNGIPLSGDDLRNAMEDLLAKKTAPEKQYPSAGCNIKWK